jgi:hypothetical protein
MTPPAAAKVERMGLAELKHELRRRGLLIDGGSSPMARTGAGVGAGAGRQLKTALHFWCRFTRHHSWRRHRLQASRRFSAWIMTRTCFNQMVGHARGKHHARWRMGNVLHRMSRTKQLAALSAWHAAHVKLIYYKGVARRMVNTSQRQGQTMAFAGWVDFHCARMTVERKLAKVET